MWASSSSSPPPPPPPFSLELEDARASSSSSSRPPVSAPPPTPPVPFSLLARLLEDARALLAAEILSKLDPTDLALFARVSRDCKAAALRRRCLAGSHIGTLVQFNSISLHTSHSFPFPAALSLTPLRERETLPRVMIGDAMLSPCPPYPDRGGKEKVHRTRA